MKFTSGYKTKTELVLERLRTAIVEGELLPGEPVPILELSRQIQVSMAPVREALRLLEAEGLVESTPHKGARVVPLSVENIWEIFLVRSRLEGLAAKVVSENPTAIRMDRLRELVASMDDCLRESNSAGFGNLNVDFHLALYESAPPRLATLLRDLFGQTQRYRLMFKVVPERMQESQRDHHRILAYLMSGPGESGIDDIELFVREHVWAAAHILMESTRSGLTAQQQDAGKGGRG